MLADDMTDHENEATPQGSLADAIAQHLDLKREHGAGDAEVDAERDAALGPARREAGGSAPPREPAAEPEPVAPDSEPSDATSAPVAPEPIDAIVEAPAPSAPAPSQADAMPAQDDDDSVEFDFGAPVDEAPSGDFLAADSEPAESNAPSSEPAPTPRSEAAPTPHVFDETPEYDRLWFEEKSPRDFDF